MHCRHPPPPFFFFFSHSDSVKKKDCPMFFYYSFSRITAGRGGNQLFFQVGVCGPDFRIVGYANWYLLLTGGLWTENFQIWGSCELKVSKFRGLPGRLLSWKFPNLEVWELQVVKANISKFSQKGVFFNWHFCLKWDPCELQEGREKAVFRAAHPHTPFLGQCPPPRPKLHELVFEILFGRKLKYGP